jgi:ABC-type antimicrobial peptide transport system permease subunit
MLGVYGVTAYNVRRQQREFGIRLALGAAPRAVRGLVIGRGLVASGLGVAAGACGAWLLTRVLESMLNDVTARDARVFIGTAAGVFIVALVASYLPARTAARVDPIVVLRDA